jgi:hypothetical protein
MSVVRVGRLTVTCVGFDRRSLAILADTFDSVILPDQDPWRETEGTEGLLRLIPDKGTLYFITLPSRLT